MELLNVIWRMSLRLKLPIRENARRTGLSRNTVRKQLKADTIEPKFVISDRPSKLDPFAEKLAGWMKLEAGTSRKQRRTLKQLPADLVALGFTGSYSRVAAIAREWRPDRQREPQTTGRGTFVPLVFRPGEAFRFDWSEDYAMLGGERTKRARSPISSCRTAGLFWSEPIFCKPTRCCLTPAGMGSVSSVEFRIAASTTI